MDTRVQNERYAEIGADLIKKEKALEHIRDSQATIVYLSSEQKKVSDGQKVFAQCEKIPQKYKWGLPCDFTITVFEPNVEGMNEEQIRILLFHELLHVGITKDDEGKETYSTVPHDLADFKLIIDRFGTDWSEIKDM